MSKAKYWIVVFVSAFILITVWSLFKDFYPGPKRGNKAPPFSLPNRSNQKISLNNFQDKVVLVNFWASWCGPCVEEMDSLEKLYQKLKERNFEVVAVSLDEDGWKPIHAFLKKNPVTFTILLDETFAVAESYGTYRVPESFLISKSGEILEKIVGPQNWIEKKITDKIENYLDKK